MPGPHPSSFRRAISSCVWGMNSLLLVFLGSGVLALLRLSPAPWLLAWLFEAPAIFAAILAIKQGYAAREQATMQRELAVSTAGLVAGYLACFLALLLAFCLSLFLSIAQNSCGDIFCPHF